MTKVIEGKLLIFSLMRTGCIHYSATMMAHLQDLDPEIYVSNTYFDLYPKNVKKWITYFGSISFIIHTFIALFFLFFFVLYKKLQHKNLSFYFPSYHPWNYILNIYAKLFSIKSIQTVHEYEYHSGENNAVLRKIKHWNIALADQLVFLSNHELNNSINQNKVLSTKSKILKHPILKWPGISKNKLQHSSKLKLIMLGRISPYKGLENLIEALLPIWDQIDSLTIAGKSMFGQKRNLNLATPLKNKIKHIDRHLKEIEISQLLTDHHVLILPYKEASQSGVIPLGIDANIPMVITSVGGLMEQVSQEAALFCGSNPADLTTAIRNLIDHPAIYIDIKNKLEAFKTEFEADWQKEFNAIFKQPI